MEASATRKAKHPVKKIKMLVSKDVPCKNVASSITPRKAVPPEAPRGEGSSRQKDKAMSRPRSMRDLCRVRVRSQNESFLAREMVDLSELSGRVGSKLAGPH
ncbi:hypothetical protein GW17_00026393 [Ensete ventricosum]|uniref:Uncharacterized protein n=1 Tax=Ensete ventricosum TaxID=4639 RepID=A0A444EI92_ENSVE|nr:hypothetical protein GW17_00026393 [Ensete ventricosum]RZR74356.1 hypothetical protein BHM03_00035834 [Ensete ventricosum]